VPELAVLAPLAGQVVALDAVPDEVFASAMLGPGVAIVPDRDDADDGDRGRVAVLAPVAGVVAALHPHAFAVRADDDADAPGGPERAVLVHLGIDTVQLRGEGFEVHVAQGDRVEAGRPLVTWSPAEVTAGGRSAIVPVIAMGASPTDVVVATGVPVRTGDPLLRWA
jgi:sugar PTS system EIIA component